LSYVVYALTREQVPWNPRFRFTKWRFPNWQLTNWCSVVYTQQNQVMLSLSYLKVLWCLTHTMVYALFLFNLPLRSAHI